MGSENEVLIVVPPIEYQDAELAGVVDALSEASIGIKITSTNANECKGVAGDIVIPELTLDDVNIERFDGVVFIGGPGAESLLHEQSAHDIARGFFDSKKLVAAICWATAVLANAGILRGVEATVWEGAKDDLIKNGAKYTDKPVVVDGKIITANGPDAAIEFGHEIAKMLTG